MEASGSRDRGAQYGSAVQPSIVDAGATRALCTGRAVHWPRRNWTISTPSCWAESLDALDKSFAHGRHQARGGEVVSSVLTPEPGYPCRVLQNQHVQAEVDFQSLALFRRH